MKGLSLVDTYVKTYQRTKIEAEAKIKVLKIYAYPLWRCIYEI